MFTAAEERAIPRFLQHAATVSCVDDFNRLIQDELPLLFPHRVLICGIGYITPENTVHTFRILNFGFPMAYLREIRTEDGGISSPVMQKWIVEGRPQLYDAATIGSAFPPEWQRRFSTFGLVNLAAHGLIDRRQRHMSYFNFCDMPGPLGSHQEFLLDILIPPLHAALLRVIEDAPPLGIEPGATQTSLTSRERQLLQQLALGLDQQHIADSLNISEHTVRNHLRNLYTKLGVKKATQALEKAKRLHLL